MTPVFLFLFFGSIALMAWVAKVIILDKPAALRAKHEAARKRRETMKLL